MLKEHASKLGIGENVIFTGQRSDIAALMAACDVFSLPSFEEPFGLVFAEAMAMKRPVVALTNGGTPEVVEHGKCGLLSPPGDIDALAANLLRLLDNPALRTQFGEYGRSRSSSTSRHSAWRQTLPRFMRASWREAICLENRYCLVPGATEPLSE